MDCLIVDEYLFSIGESLGEESCRFTLRSGGLFLFL